MVATYKVYVNVIMLADGDRVFEMVIVRSEIRLNMLDLGCNQRHGVKHHPCIREYEMKRRSSARIEIE